MPGDTNLSDDVFWQDNLIGVTRRVSVATSGREGNFSSRNPDISADGRFVVFESFASRLVPGDTNGRDIVVHDVAAGTTSLVSVRSDGTQGTGDTGNPGISGDGRFVVFESSASDLVPGDTNGQSDIFLHDMVSGATTRVSLSSAGAQGTGGGSQFPVISADGGVVAFASDATDLVPGDTNDSTDLFTRELATGVTRRVSVSSSGEQNQRPELSVPALSADGTMVAFSSAAGNLVPGDTNLINDVFVHDTAAGTTTR